MDGEGCAGRAPAGAKGRGRRAEGSHLGLVRVVWLLYGNICLRPIKRLFSRTCKWHVLRNGKHVATFSGFHGVDWRVVHFLCPLTCGSGDKSLRGQSARLAVDEDYTIKLLVNPVARNRPN